MESAITRSSPWGPKERPSVRNRENLGSRLGFILLTAGCAIGLGNIWRFPFITGKYGGAIFVLVYLLFLLLLGFPVMVMELAAGRASRRTLYGACRVLPARKRFRWEIPGGIFFAGSAILMIFYTTVTGWMLAYAWDYLRGSISELDAVGVENFFGNFLGASTAAFNALAGVDRCGYCNSSLNDIVSSGKMGCAHCYDKFYEQLYPSLERMHGNVHHIGKHVHYTQENDEDAKKEAPKAENPLSEVDRLKEELKEAIKTQNFEQAAVLRDKIKELEGDK